MLRWWGKLLQWAAVHCQRRIERERESRRGDQCSTPGLVLAATKEDTRELAQCGGAVVAREKLMASDFGVLSSNLSGALSKVEIGDIGEKYLTLSLEVRLEDIEDGGGGYEELDIDDGESSIDAGGEKE